MVRLATNHCLKQREKCSRSVCSQVGLTLIEVLIALAIISIAMTAIIKGTSQNIRATTYLQDKMIAVWVGQQLLNEVRAGVRILPNESGPMKVTTKMLGKEWFSQLSQEETPNRRIKRISVKVFSNEDEDAQSLLTLNSYLYREES